MKKCLLLFVITILLFVPSFMDAMAAEPIETVIKFFEASKNGDVGTIKHLIEGPFYNRRKILLEMNKGYPEFLKKFYGDATLEPLQYEIGNADMVKTNHLDLYNKHYSAPNININGSVKRVHNELAVVIVKLQFPDRSWFNTKFLLKQNKNNVWKIYDEILITN